MSRFRYWLGSPQGALVYFGVSYGLLAIAWWFGLLLLTWWLL